MAFVLVTTTWSLVLQANAAFEKPLELSAATLNGVVSVALLGLALFLVLESGLALRRHGSRGPESWATR